MNRYRYYVFILICAALSACVYREPEIPTALTALHQQAKAGNTSAQLELGIRYATGNGIMADEAAALHWIGLAANQGYAAAQYELGSYYTFESSRNDDEAVRWLRSAAEQGHAPAQFSLGLLYVAGRGVPADPKEAYAWLSLAADQGDVEAMQIRTNIANRMEEAEFQRAQQLHSKYRKKFVLSP